MSLFFDGFEQYSYAEGGEFVKFIRHNQYEVFGSNITLAGGKSVAGVPKEQQTAISLTDTYVTRVHDWNGPTFSVGAAIKFSSRGGLLRLTTHIDSLDLWVSRETGLLNVAAANGGAVPVTNRYYYYEMRLNRAANTVDVFINGKQDIFAVNVPFDLSGSDTVTVQLFPYDVDPVTGDAGGSMVPQGSRTYDDFYINDGNILGPVSVFTRVPTSEDLAEWGNSTTPEEEGEEGDPNWLVASGENMDVLDKYLYANEDDLEDKYRSDYVVSSLTVRALGMSVYARKTVPNPLGITVFTDSHEHNFAALTQQFAYYTTVLPTAIGYNKASVESSVFGIKSTSS